jgi:hypothetical protein
MMEVDDKFECNAGVEIYYVLFRSFPSATRRPLVPNPKPFSALNRMSLHHI